MSKLEKGFELLYQITNQENLTNKKKSKVISFDRVKSTPLLGLKIQYGNTS